MVGKLRRYYRFGHLAKTEGAIKRLSKRHGLSQSSVRKMREFRERYSVAEFETLCELRRPNGLPIHWGYVPYLLTVTNKTTRAGLETAVASKGWTAPELYAQIRARRKPAEVDRGGRRPKKPASPELELDVYLPEARRYLARCKAACSELLTRPPRQRRRLQRLREQALELRSMARAVGKMMDQLTCEVS